jgi:hypothetical protein
MYIHSPALASSRVSSIDAPMCQGASFATWRRERQDRDEPLGEGKLLLGQQSLAADARRTGTEQPAGKSI